MSGTVIAFVVIALAIGVLVGWLLGSRDGAGAKQTVESLRLQLNTTGAAVPGTLAQARRGRLGNRTSLVAWRTRTSSPPHHSRPPGRPGVAHRARRASPA